jgi:hypothetical protein
MDQGAADAALAGRPYGRPSRAVLGHALIEDLRVLRRLRTSGSSLWQGRRRLCHRTAEEPYLHDHVLPRAHGAGMTRQNAREWHPHAATERRNC